MARMNTFSRDLLQGMREAVAYMEGNADGARVTEVPRPDVSAIRRQLRMSQQRFAEAYQIPLATLKNWEQGRRLPDAPALAFLKAIAREPEAIRKALSEES